MIWSFVHSFRRLSIRGNQSYCNLEVLFVKRDIHFCVECLIMLDEQLLLDLLFNLFDVLLEGDQRRCRKDTSVFSSRCCSEGVSVVPSFVYMVLIHISDFRFSLKENNLDLWTQKTFFNTNPLVLCSLSKSHHHMPSQFLAMILNSLVRNFSQILRHECRVGKQRLLFLF